MVLKSWLTAGLFMALTPGQMMAETKKAQEPHIRGLYGSNCLEGSGVSAVKDLLLREETMETVQTVYSDLNCERPSYDFSFSGPYDYDPLTGFLNYSYASIKLQALDPQVVEQFNESALCGFNDWVLNKAKEVTGLDCGGQLIPARNTEAFDLLRPVADGAVTPSIQLGLISDLDDGLSPETRPSQTESLIYYPK